MREQVDTYGFPVKTRRRLRGCRCKVPCQKAFSCRSVFHRVSGSSGRRVAWCFGGSWPGVTVCDDCYMKRAAKMGARHGAKLETSR